ncbi:MAG: hypothetical protein LC792_16725 [Actinobacteria bacterium]|nr:hypothetical protein [Actinomycetota bacterium]
MTTHQPELRTDDPAAGVEVFETSSDITVEGDQTGGLFSPEVELRFNRRWADIQSHFVDDPRDTVACADDLVTEVMDRIGDWFAERRSALGRQWTADSEADTEDLRLAMQRYRDLLQRLLSV